MLYDNLPESSGVYAIINNKLNRVYVGYSSRIRSKVRVIEYDLNKSYPRNTDMLNDWKNDNSGFTSKVLELTDDTSKKEYYIRQLGSNVTGYNKKLNMYWTDIPQEAGVYAITINGIVKYIGYSKRMKNRVKDHIQDLTNNRHFNEELQKDWNNDKLSLLFEVIELTLDKTRETYHIKRFNTIENGYNSVISVKEDFYERSILG